MRNRVPTIIIALAVTLLGVPRVWQEFGNLWASVQHKTQAKFLGLALNSQAREQGEALEAAAGPAEYLALNQTCEAAQTAGISGRQSAQTSGRVRNQGQATDGAGFEPALAHRDRVKDDAESLTHSLPAPQAGENLLAMHNVATVQSPAPYVYMNENEVAQVIALHQSEQAAPVYLEKGPDFRLIEKDPDFQAKIRKALEESKLGRQKVRFVYRTAPLPPPPTS